MVSTRLIFILGVISIVIFLLTFILHRYFQKSRVIKYYPTIICFILGFYNLYLSKINQNGFKDLGYIFLSMIFFYGFGVGAFSGLMIDYVIPKLKR